MRLAGAGSWLAAPPLGTSAPSTMPAHALSALSSKNPVFGSTALLPLTSMMVPSGLMKYFFRLPGQCADSEAWNTVMNSSFRLRVRLKALTEIVGAVNVVLSCRISVTMLVSATVSEDVSSAV